jgi:hypothetical protein
MQESILQYADHHESVLLGEQYVMWFLFQGGFPNCGLALQLYRVFGGSALAGSAASALTWNVCFSAAIRG